MKTIIIVLLFNASLASMPFGEMVSIRGKVLKVVDGDTIKVQVKDGRRFTVRFLGIDTPESYKRRFGYVEFLGKKVSRFLKEQIAHKDVRLEVFKKNGKYDTDRYGRLLAYVYAEDKDICALLLKKGYAKVYQKSICTRQAEFLKYEKNARMKKLGIWNLDKVEKFYRNQYKRTENKKLILWFWDNDKPFLKGLLE